MGDNLQGIVFSGQRAVKAECWPRGEYYMEDLRNQFVCHAKQVSEYLPTESVQEFECNGKPEGLIKCIKLVEMVYTINLGSQNFETTPFEEVGPFIHTRRKLTSVMMLKTPTIMHMEDLSETIKDLPTMECPYHRVLVREVGFKENKDESQDSGYLSVLGRSTADDISTDIEQEHRPRECSMDYEVLLKQNEILKIKLGQYSETIISLYEEIDRQAEHSDLQEKAIEYLVNNQQAESHKMFVVGGAVTATVVDEVTQELISRYKNQKKVEIDKLHESANTFKSSIIMLISNVYCQILYT